MMVTYPDLLFFSIFDFGLGMRSGFENNQFLTDNKMEILKVPDSLK